MRSRTFATLTLIALLAGCGDDPPGSVIQPDASGDAVGDGTPPPDGQPPPPDGTPMDDVPTPPPDMAPPPDVVDMDVPTPPPDVVDTDVPPPPDAVDMDVPVGMDTPPPPDADGPDVTPPPDTAPPPDADGPDVVPPPDVPVMTGIAGHRGTALVSNGAVMRSPSYKLVSTLGQSSVHQTVMRSLGFRLRGGLVGATGGSR